MPLAATRIFQFPQIVRASLPPCPFAQPLWQSISVASHKPTGPFGVQLGRDVDGTREGSTTLMHADDPKLSEGGPHVGVDGLRQPTRLEPPQDLGQLFAQTLGATRGECRDGPSSVKTFFDPSPVGGVTRFQNATVSPSVAVVTSHAPSLKCALYNSRSCIPSPEPSSCWTTAIPGRARLRHSPAQTSSRLIWGMKRDVQIAPCWLGETRRAGRREPGIRLARISRGTSSRCGRTPAAPPGPPPRRR